MISRTVTRRMCAALVCGLLAAPGCRRSVPVVTTPVPPLQTVPAPASAAEDFGRLFCGVLEFDKADPGAWDYCAAYLRVTGTPQATLPAIPATHRILVIPGIFGQCVEPYARPFSDAADHLREKHQLPVEYLSVDAMGGTEHNARQIAAYLAREFPKEPYRPYIVFGYSKGAADVLEAIQSHQSARDAISAVVTVAGSILGSRLAEGADSTALAAVQRARIGTCGIGDGKGLQSLRRVERAEAMTKLRLGSIRAYSVAAVSTSETTRPVLRTGWRTLSAYSLEQDSQVIHEDAIVPGGTYLGMALGDHWAVALPFERLVPTTDEAKRVKRLMAFRDYPRGALFEAALRYVLAETPTLKREPR